MASSITFEAFEQQAVAIISNGLKECTDTFCATLEQRAAETKRANDMLLASFHVPTTRQEKIAAFPGLIHLIDQAEEADRIRCIISHAKIRAKRKEVADRLRALPVPDCMKEHRAKTWFRMAKRRMTLPRTRKRSDIYENPFMEISIHGMDSDDLGSGDFSTTTLVG